MPVEFYRETEEDNPEPVLRWLNSLAVTDRVTMFELMTDLENGEPTQWPIEWRSATHDPEILVRRIRYRKHHVLFAKCDERVLVLHGYTRGALDERAEFEVAFTRVCRAFGIEEAPP